MFVILVILSVIIGLNEKNYYELYRRWLNEYYLRRNEILTLLIRRIVVFGSNPAIRNVSFSQISVVGT